jgi:hypothetical protein
VFCDTAASSGAAHLRVTWDHPTWDHLGHPGHRRTEGSTRLGSGGKPSWGWDLQESSLRIDPWEDDLCPTKRNRKLRKRSKRNTSTYAALEGTAVHVVSVKLTNGHGGVLMRVHLNESKPAVRLEASFGDISKVLEERDQVGLRSVWSEITNIARGLPLRSLGDDHIVALDSVSRKVVVSERSSGCHSHGGHCLLLRDGWLSLLVGPVAADGARPKPLAVHGAQCAISISTVAEGNETISTRPPGLHVPHDAGLRDRAESRESLEKDLIVDLIGQVADKDVVVVRSVLLGGVVGLISPVDADFLSESDVSRSPSQHASLRCCGCDGR